MSGRCQGDLPLAKNENDLNEMHGSIFNAFGTFRATLYIQCYSLTFYSDKTFTVNTKYIQERIQILRGKIVWEDIGKTHC